MRISVATLSISFVVLPAQSVAVTLMVWLGPSGTALVMTRSVTSPRLEQPTGSPVMTLSFWPTAPKGRSIWSDPGESSTHEASPNEPLATGTPSRYAVALLRPTPTSLACTLRRSAAGSDEWSLSVRSDAGERQPPTAPVGALSSVTFIAMWDTSTPPAPAPLTRRSSWLPDAAATLEPVSAASPPLRVSKIVVGLVVEAVYV